MLVSFRVRIVSADGLESWRGSETNRSTKPASTNKLKQFSKTNLRGWYPFHVRIVSADGLESSVGSETNLPPKLALDHNIAGILSASALCGRGLCVTRGFGDDPPGETRNSN